MARNHVNYAIGRYSIEPMASAGIEKTCTTFTGKLCEVKEKLTYKKTGFYHWLSLGFDADSMGPTKRIFFNIQKDKEIIWLFQMAKDNIVLQEGDEVTLEYAGKSITVIVNGEEVPQVKASRTSAIYKELYRCRRNDSIDDVLRAVCPWALPADVRDETVGESVYRCREMLFNMVLDASEYELRLLVGKLFLSEAVCMTFEEIHEELRKLMSKKSLTEILSSTEACGAIESVSEPVALDSLMELLAKESEVAVYSPKRRVTQKRKGKKGTGRKDRCAECGQSQDEFAINDFVDGNGKNT